MITLAEFQQVKTQLDTAQKTIADLEALVAKLKKTKLNKGVMSSEDPTWETPDDLFYWMHQEFKFTIDICAEPHTAKLPTYYTPQQDAFTQSWAGRVWMNPPYGRPIKQWMQRAYTAANTGEAEVVVCLVPHRAGSNWWCDYALHSAEIREIRGRLRFKGAPSGAPFPSALVIFKPGQETPYRYLADKQGRKVQP